MPSSRRCRARPAGPQLPPVPASDDQEIAETGTLRVQLVDAHEQALPHIDTVVDGSGRRYFIGQPGRQFGLRVDYGDWLSRQRRQKWVVRCEMDGRDVGTSYFAGLDAKGRRIDDTDCAFGGVRSYDNHLDYKMVMNETTVRKVERSDGHRPRGGSSGG